MQSASQRVRWQMEVPRARQLQGVENALEKGRLGAVWPWLGVFSSRTHLRMSLVLWGPCGCGWW